MNCKKTPCPGKIEKHDYYPIYSTERDGKFLVEIEATCSECGAEYRTNIMAAELKLIK